MKIALVVFGIFSWTFLEYALHRWILHRGPKPFKRAHAGHHKDPLDNGDLTWENVLWAFIGLYSVTVPVIGADFALFYIGGVFVGYMGFTTLHYQLHRKDFRGFRGPTAVAGKLQRHHEIHHIVPGKNFGVTTDLWDRLFGTKGPRV